MKMDMGIRTIDRVRSGCRMHACNVYYIHDVYYIHGQYFPRSLPYSCENRNPSAEYQEVSYCASSLSSYLFSSTITSLSNHSIQQLVSV